MSLAEFAKNELKVRLSYFQRDALEILERDPDAWQRILKPSTHEVRMVLEIFREWKNRYNSQVAC